MNLFEPNSAAHVPMLKYQYNKPTKPSAYNLSNPFIKNTKNFANNLFESGAINIPTPNFEINHDTGGKSLLLQSNIDDSLKKIIDGSIINLFNSAATIPPIIDRSCLDVLPATIHTISNLDVAVDMSQEPENEEICAECNIRLRILEDSMICENCGIEKRLNAEYNPEFYNVSIETNYNGGTSSSMPFMFSGKKSYGYQKALLKSCSDYTNASYQLIKKDIINRINMYNGNKPPMNVQLACVDLYYKIKKNDKIYLKIINEGQNEKNIKKRLVFRSNGKWGLIASCLYQACAAEGLTRTPREISEIINVEEKYQSIGDKRLQEFHELGIVNILVSIRLIDDYIARYFPLLNIPAKYQQFVTHIINRADKKYLHINNENRISTKCIGAIYMLCSRVPELCHITKDVIARECKVSKTTFLKYYATLQSGNKVLKKSFKKFGIPMPVEWKDRRKWN